MYVPPPFAEADLAKLHQFIEDHSFGVLVSAGMELTASHLPLLLDRSGGSQGRLIGHMARANPQWRQADGGPVLVIFTGPHAYVSPRLYQSENVVPTWNYVAVHAYGTFRAIEEQPVVLQIVRDSVQRYERHAAEPWEIGESSAYLDSLAAHIVGFDIEILRIEGKWKLSQNQSRQRRERVIEGLADSADPAARQIAELMRAALDFPSGQ